MFKIGLSLLLWMAIAQSAQASVELRVAIKKKVDSISVASSTTAIVKGDRQQKVGQIEGMNAITAQIENKAISYGEWESSQLLIKPSEDGLIWIEDRWYRGDVLLIIENNGITAINYVDLEDYLYSVVGAEAIASWPLEALKAQAVAARSYALYQREQSKNELYDLDTTVATQVYKGLNSEYSTTHEAVNATRGEIMTYNGEVILAVFHSSSGGHTENVEDIWPNALPYLRAVVDYDQQSPVYQWQRIFSFLQLSQLIGSVGNVKEMIPVKTTPLGRIVTMTVVGDLSSQDFSGNELRRLLDLPSTLFKVSVTDEGFVIDGKGFGHGLGLSQWGAYYLATQGVNYQQILTHYYPNATLSKLK